MTRPALHLPARRPRLVPGVLRRADAGPGRRAGRPSPRGESTLLLAPTGSGKTLAAFLACIDRVMFSPVPPRASAAGCLRLAAQGAGRGRGAEPARPDHRHRQRGRRPRRRVPPPHRRRPHRRHRRQRARPVPARAGRHPHHHPRVALSAAHLQRPRGAAERGDGHRRRDPRPGAHQARGAPGAVAGAAGAPRRPAAAAHRALRHPAAARRGGPIPRGPWPPEAASAPTAPSLATRRPRSPGERVIALATREDASEEFAVTSGGIRWRPVTVVDAGNRKSLSLRIEVPVEDMAQHRRADRAPLRAGGPGDGADLDLDRHPPPAAGAHPPAPLHAALRQQPAHRRAAGRGAQRAGRRAAGPCPPRLAGPRASARRSRTR